MIVYRQQYLKLLNYVQTNGLNKIELFVLHRSAWNDLNVG